MASPPHPWPDSTATRRRLAVVAYPTLADDDRRWIDGLRARHDPRVPGIAAHLTLVFPTDVAEAPLVAHARNALHSFAPIPVVLRRASVFPNAAQGGYCVFLLADQGHAALVALHDALYSGILAAHRARDFAFVPHVTVGAHPQRDECERMAGRLNTEGRVVRAQVDSVHVVEAGASAVRTVAEIALPAGHRPAPDLPRPRPGASEGAP